MTDTTPAPSPIRGDDLRAQHRRTLRHILCNAERRALTADEMRHLRRVTDAEQAECDGARKLADEWQANALTTADRCDEQAERTRKARAQRDAARERATKAEAERDAAHARADGRVEAAEGWKAHAVRRREQRDQARADAERYKGDYLGACQTIAEMHAAATGRHGEAPTRGVVEDVADVRTRAMLAEQQLDVAQDHRCCPHYEGDTGADVCCVCDQPTDGQLTPITDDECVRPASTNPAALDGTGDAAPEPPRDSVKRAGRPFPMPDGAAEAYGGAPTESEPRERCCACGRPDVAYRNYNEQPFCGPCAEPEHASPDGEPCPDHAEPEAPCFHPSWGTEATIGGRRCTDCGEWLDPEPAAPLVLDVGAVREAHRILGRILVTKNPHTPA